MAGRRTKLTGRVLRAEHAVVASGQPLASAAGSDVLKDGGNAFDAAVATSFVLAVTLHPAGGIGGDFLGMFYEAKTGKVLCLNSSGWSPSGLTLDRALGGSGSSIPQFGPRTAMVPGYVAGVLEMHHSLGILDFGGLLSSATGYASSGFPATEGICRSTAGAFAELSPDARAIFAPGGSPPTPGEPIRQANLAKVIAEIAEKGPDAFYSGWPAEIICKRLTDLGVPTSMADFSQFRPEWVTPISLDYKGIKVYETPPNSMGATTLLILNLLLLDGLSGTGPLSKERIQQTMTAVIPAYARRDEMLGDPRFSPFDLATFLQLPSATPARTQRVNPGDTTAFSIADSEGNLASCIQSLFNQFGSRVFVPECGIMMNNRGAGFSVSGPNKVEPRKRPLNTLSSMILERGGRPLVAAGTSGGEYRPLQHTLFVTNAVDYAMGLEQNVGHQRFLWGGGRSLLVEAGYKLPSGKDFEVQTVPMPGPTGVCQAVEVSDRFRTAVCDPRGDGIPMGF